MYVLRKQKRGVIRRNPDLRNPIDASLVYEIASLLISNIYAIRADAVDLTTRMQMENSSGGCDSMEILDNKHIHGKNLRDYTAKQRGTKGKHSMG